MEKKEKQKTYMFQYYNGWHTSADTGLITLEEALELWKKYKSDFVKRLEMGEDVEIAIWKDCQSDTDYGDTLVHLNSECEYRGGRFYETKKIYASEEIDKLNK